MSGGRRRMSRRGGSRDLGDGVAQGAEADVEGIGMEMSGVSGGSEGMVTAVAEVDGAVVDVVIVGGEVEEVERVDVIAMRSVGRLSKGRIVLLPLLLRLLRPNQKGRFSSTTYSIQQMLY